MNKETLDRVILILQSKMNFHAQKVLDEYPVKVETFPVSSLNLLTAVLSYDAVKQNSEDRSVDC